MKTFAVVLAVVGLSAVSAFQPPLMATRAVTPKKAASKSRAATKVVAKKAAPKKKAATKVVAKKAAPKKVVAKKAAPKKVVTKAAPKARKPPPASKGYPMLDLGIKFKLSGGGNKAPSGGFSVPDFSDPKLQIKRDPAFYAAAAKTRGIGKQSFAYDDGLTDLERKQRGTVMSTFLTGSAISRADTSLVRDDIEEGSLDFGGLDADRFQLLFISVFGLLTLVGCLSGSVKL
uniref:Uncharacterized protein n=1 Tax=Corethron hystrix TaxID=216773 RepID=A0A7S1BF72_9STRA|mmetsp:Transcript_25625/g.59129  ORF Transcript_25625/g.59129 Transcript_25625/m.59129 type:complete len:231 (+) Transcript_25625:83-775(+)